MNSLSFEQAVKNIAQAINPEQIILFGSRANQTHHADSDYDLLIVVPNTTEDTLQIAGEALYAARGKRFSLDVVVYTQNEFEYSQQEKHDVVYHAMKNAKVVYEKSHARMD